MQGCKRRMQAQDCTPRDGGPRASSCPLRAWCAGSGALGNGLASRAAMSRPALKLRKCSANSGTDTYRQGRCGCAQYVCWSRREVTCRPGQPLRKSWPWPTVGRP